MCSGLAFDEMVQSPPLFAQTRRRRAPFWMLLHDHMAQRGGHLSGLRWDSLVSNRHIRLSCFCVMFCVTDK